MTERGCRSVTEQPAKPEAAYPKPGVNQDIPDQRRNHVAAVAAEHVRRGGIPIAERDLYDHAKFASNLADDFVPVNLEYSGLHIQHLSPPILTVDDFMSPAECQQLAEFTHQTGIRPHTCMFLLSLYLLSLFAFSLLQLETYTHPLLMHLYVSALYTLSQYLQISKATLKPHSLHSATKPLATDV